MTEHRRSSRSRSRSGSKTRSRSAHSDKHKRSKSKSRDVFFEDDDSSSDGQSTPSTSSSQEPSRRQRRDRNNRTEVERRNFPPGMKSCCRQRVKFLDIAIASDRPTHIMETRHTDKLREERFELLQGDIVCEYHGKEGQRRKKREAEEQRQEARKWRLREKKMAEEKARRRAKRKEAGLEELSDTASCATTARVRFRKQSKKAMKPFVDHETTTSLYILGKKHPVLATFHRFAYLAFQQLGVPKPVPLMPKKDRARYKKLARSRSRRH